MESWKSVLVCLMCAGLFLFAPSGIVLTAAAQQATTSDKPSQSHSADLPDSPGATLARLQEPSAQQNNSTPSSTTGQDQSTAAPANQAEPAPQKPVGTAAAEAPRTSGMAASQPAGVAIAPAKQHRTRTLVLRVGAIIGAGVAVGTVIGLTEATSSRPPGTH